MTNGFGPTIENAKKQQAYIDSLKQQSGELLPYNPSLREKSVNIATNVIGALPFGGGGDYYDRKIAKNLFGDYYEENIADSIGVLDFTPAGLIYGVDEALREYGEAEKLTDFILPTVGLGLSALEAYPVTKIATRPLRRFLSNLANKTSSAPTLSHALRNKCWSKPPKMAPKTPSRKIGSRPSCKSRKLCTCRPALRPSVPQL